MKREKINDIQTDFYLSNEEFTKLICKKFTVSLVQMDGTIQFETRIPDYIYEEAKKRYPDVYDQNFIDELVKEDIKKYGCSSNLKQTRATSKILRSPTLDVIKGQLETLSNKLITLNTFKDTVGDKVLFIYFNGNTTQQRESHYGGNMGLVNSIRFQYFVAFYFNGVIKEYLTDKEILVEKYSAYYKCGIADGEWNKWREEELKPLHYTEKDKDNLKMSYLIIPWSEEREEYLKKIQDNFTEMTNKLNEFLKDLTEIKLDHLIENHPIGKLLPE